MRWVDPEIGTRKFVTKFLLLPLKIRRQTRWLETVTVEYKYTIGHLSGHRWWVATNFIDEELKEGN